MCFMVSETKVDISGKLRVFSHLVQLLDLNQSLISSPLLRWSLFTLYYLGSNRGILASSTWSCKPILLMDGFFPKMDRCSHHFCCHYYFFTFEFVSKMPTRNGTCVCLPRMYCKCLKSTFILAVKRTRVHRNRTPHHLFKAPYSLPKCTVITSVQTLHTQ